MDFFERHTRIALQLSAGKDSAACLWLLEPYWDRMDVVWCNMGNPYPETLEYMFELSLRVPNFFVVKGEQPYWIRQHGYPVDVLPFVHTKLGADITGQKRLQMQPFSVCCAENFWKPMHAFMKEQRYTGIIRGQKKSDRLKGPIKSGHKEDGVEYFFPIEDWTDEQVISFLGHRVPESYKRGLTSSLDCKNCTAYVSENPGRISDLATIDLLAAKEVIMVHQHLATALDEYSAALKA